MLLEAPQALADLPRAHRADAVDRLEVAVARANDGVEAAEVAHDVADDAFREPRELLEHPVAARRDGEVERVRVARIPEQLGELLEVDAVAA